MMDRLIQFDKNEHFFLFGHRGTGESTLLHALFDPAATPYLDLLQPELEDEFPRFPQSFRARVLGTPPETTHVVIDEVQKAPKPGMSARMTKRSRGTRGFSRIP